MSADIVPLDQVRAAREADRAKKTRPIGACAAPRGEECGMKDPAECTTHGPYLPPDAS